jgi:hypothetical protein
MIFIICASGESLTPEDVEFVRGKGSVIVINNTYQLAPWADILYSCDAAWWRLTPEAQSFKGRKISIMCKEVETWPHAMRPGLGKDKINTGGINTGGNSGYQAINLAYLLGAKKIVLLGFDMHGTHWHGRHKKGLSNIHMFEEWIKNFTQLAQDLKDEGVEVINATRRTKLFCFRREPLEAIDFGQ